jgi:choline dehydrogenase-like flavoprotein
LEGSFTVFHPSATVERAMQGMEYDAIVVGSGIAGGWAAKELTECGRHVLLLERGCNIEHITATIPWGGVAVFPA